MPSKASIVVLAGAAIVGAFYAGPLVFPEMKPKRDALVAQYPLLAQLPGLDVPATAKPEGAAQSPANAAGGGRPGAGGGGRPAVPVATAKVVRQAMPVRFDTIGTVQPIATVTLRSRVESQVLSVNFEDGANVKQGDILYQLDSRGIEAQIKQAEANLSRSRAQLEQAKRDVARNEALAANEYASRQKLDDSRTAVQTVAAQIRSDEAVLENLNVQLSYYTIRAPINGRIGVAGVKTGNIAKTGDSSVPLATINQISPIYVSFAVPQRLLPELRTALAEGTSKVQATPQGLTDAVDGKIAVIENSVDAASGTILLRGIFENQNDVLWPGALCDVRLVIRTEPNAVVVPREAVQTGQNGPLVFTITDGVAKVRPVVVDRTLRGLTVIKTGLNGDETVVTDGQLLLTDGARVEQRGGGGGGGRPPGASEGAPPTVSAPALRGAPASVSTPAATPPAPSAAPLAADGKAPAPPPQTGSASPNATKGAT